ncbi:MAG: aminodeoxychorismate/anthranilate synthase component II [Prevotellaceae bacterium]|jgi:anthranilate synthase component 2|nr:aminodeoxychorismate/anthranilate synthase component II [Prevotellaceae bacterium]
MKILVFDNYDSFTYNLVHMLRQLNAQNVDVIRNDKIALESISTYDKIILSPGPGIPSESGILLPLIKEYAASKSILGVCLGEQAIGEAFGAQLINLDNVYHGVATNINIIKEDILFNGLSNTIEVGRYHSWIVSQKAFPYDTLDITAVDDEGNIMALAHKTYDVRGVQFHPESVLTSQGLKMIENWLKK